jgi:ribosomal protein L32
MFIKAPTLIGSETVHPRWLSISSVVYKRRDVAESRSHNVTCELQQDVVARGSKRRSRRLWWRLRLRRMSHQSNFAVVETTHTVCLPFRRQYPCVHSSVSYRSSWTYTEMQTCCWHAITASMSRCPRGTRRAQSLLLYIRQFLGVH